MTPVKLSAADFSHQREVRWCPGCGDYAILKALTKVLPQTGKSKEDIVFISGIGCSGRLPYYLDTYGFHTIHGRAPAIATGVKLANPKLQVWVITGDGDGLSIGATHLLHSLRRNVDIKILLFNNQVYGLTKGQASPTSTHGQVTPTTPQGLSIDAVNPLAFALTAGASFVARSLAVDNKHLQEVLLSASQHQGSAFIEIYQNCHIFNDGVFDHIANKKSRTANALYLRHDEPYYYGDKLEQCLTFDNSGFKKTAAIDQPLQLKHDQTNSLQAYALSQLTYPDYPVPLGIFLQQQRPVFAACNEGLKKKIPVPALLAGQQAFCR